MPLDTTDTIPVSGPNPIQLDLNNAIERRSSEADFSFCRSIVGSGALFYGFTYLIHPSLPALIRCSFLHYMKLHTRVYHKHVAGWRGRAKRCRCVFFTERIANWVTTPECVSLFDDMLWGYGIAACFVWGECVQWVGGCSASTFTCIFSRRRRLVTRNLFQPHATTCLWSRKGGRS